MSAHEFVRGQDFFLDWDLAWIAARKVGIDPQEPYLSTTDCTFYENGMRFPSGTIVQWSELGHSDLRRIDILFSEYVSGLPEGFREGVKNLGSKPDGPFRFSPGEARWFLKESLRRQLFTLWGNQLGAGANSFVL